MKPYKHIAISFYDSKRTPSLKLLEQIRLMFLGMDLALTVFVSTSFEKNLNSYPEGYHVTLIDRKFDATTKGINAQAKTSLNNLVKTSYAHWVNSLAIGQHLIEGAFYEAVLAVTDKFQVNKGLRQCLKSPIEANFLFVPDQFKLQYPLLFLTSYQSNICDPSTFYRICTLWKNLDHINLNDAWGNFLARFENLELNSINFCEYFGNYMWYFWNTFQMVHIRQYKEYWPARDKL